MSTRRISTGKIGRPLLGDIFTQDNSIKSVVQNENINLQPNGTGIVESESDVQVKNGASLRLADIDNSNYVALKSPGTVAGNITYTLPGSVVDGQFLTTDASGNLSWALAAVSVTNQSTDTNTYYPTITTATTGTLTAVSVTSSKMTFVPSTGTLTATVLNGTNSITSTSGTIGTINGSSSASGTLTVRGTSSGTKATASVLMTDNVSSTSTSTGTLVVTGGVGVSGQVTTSNLVETSSITLKENISPINNALEKITKLSGVTYDRTDTKEHESGLIAEWVDEILPDLVTKDTEGNAVGIKYTKLTAYLIEAIKSMKAELDELKVKK